MVFHEVIVSIIVHFQRPHHKKNNSVVDVFPVYLVLKITKVFKYFKLLSMTSLSLSLYIYIYIYIYIYTRFILKVLILFLKSENSLTFSCGILRITFGKSKNRI